MALGAVFTVRELFFKKEVQPIAIQQTKPSTEEVLTKLREVILLPTEEQAKVSEITDAAAAKKQNPEFYTNSENGDYLIVFENELKTAIIFRVSEKKIIAIVPIVD